MGKVQTTQGLIDRADLEAKDFISEDENSRSVATEWYLRGEMVRRDVAVSILCGLALAGEAAELA